MSSIKYIILTFTSLIFLASCGEDTGGSFTQRLPFDFFQSNQGWVGDFAGIADSQADSAGLVFEWRPLPESVDSTRNGLFASGVNLNDELFMYFKQDFLGLTPGQEVRVSFQIEMVTDSPMNCPGPDGNMPGESVFVKAGASTVEPIAVVQENGLLRMNIDIGDNASSGGTNSEVLGNITNSRDCSETEADTYEFKAFDTTVEGGTVVTADENGRIWAFFGIDSDFEGTSSVYFSVVFLFIETT